MKQSNFRLGLIALLGLPPQKPLLGLPPQKPLLGLPRRKPLLGLPRRKPLLGSLLGPVLLAGAAISACSGSPSAAHDHSHHDAALAPIAPKERYRVEVYPDDAMMGDARALVTVVLYSDYACPPCARTWK